jgi:hypothetical protein
MILLMINNAYFAKFCVLGPIVQASMSLIHRQTCEETCIASQFGAH